MPGGRTDNGGGAVMPGSATCAGAGGRRSVGGGTVMFGGVLGVVGGRSPGLGDSVGERDVGELEGAERDGHRGDRPEDRLRQIQL